MATEYKGTAIGLIYTLGGLLIYYTFIVPLLIVLPLSVVLESIFSNIFKGSDYSAIGNSVIVSLLGISLIVLTFFLVKFIKQIKISGTFKTSWFVLFLTLELFIIHPLVFYVNLSNNWSRAGDGQFFMSAGETFQTSSLIFVLFGVILDMIRSSLVKKKSNFPTPLNPE